MGRVLPGRAHRSAVGFVHPLSRIANGRATHSPPSSAAAAVAATTQAGSPLTTSKISSTIPTTATASNAMPICARRWATSTATRRACRWNRNRCRLTGAMRKPVEMIAALRVTK